MPQEEYRRKRTTADEEAARIRSGDTVYLACGCLLPVDFAAALYRAAPRLRNVKVLNYLPLEPLALLSDPDCGEAFDVCSIFYNKFQQSAQALGRCSFLPTHLRNAARDLGCNGLGVLRRVIWPLSLPGVISGVTMVLIPSVSTFYISQKLGDGKIMLIGDVIEGQYVANNLHFAAAIAFILMILLLVCMAVMRKLASRHVEGGL